jgi:hypothetical protein
MEAFAVESIRHAMAAIQHVALTDRDSRLVKMAQPFSMLVQQALCAKV